MQQAISILDALELLNEDQLDADNTFTFTLDWRSAPAMSDMFWREKLGVTLSSTEAQVPGFSADPDGVTINQIAAAQGLLIDDARDFAQGLVRKGLVQERNGAIYIKERLKPLWSRAELRERSSGDRVLHHASPHANMWA